MLAISIPDTVRVAIPVAGLRHVEIQVQPDAEQSRALLDAVRCGCLQIVSEGDDRIVFLGSGDPRFSKLTLRHSLCRQSGEHDDLVVVNAVFLDVEDPLRIEAFVEPLNDGATFDVIEHVSIRALPSLDLLRRKRSFEYFSIHGSSFRIETGCSGGRRYMYIRLRA